MTGRSIEDCDKFVLGGGLSGLVAAYYNPEYTVVSPDLGGFIDSEYGRAFVVLHATDAMRQLFDELGVPSFEKRIQIGYYQPDMGVQSSFKHEESERDFARRYVEEKLPPRFQPGKDLELSAPGDEWSALFVDSSIVEALAENIERRTGGWVKDLTADEITIQPQAGREVTTEWESVISTLPATLFRKLVGVEWDLDHEPTTLAKLPREKVPDRYFGKPWNLLYAIDEATEYHRIARNMLSSRYFVECLGETDVYGASDQIVNQNGVIADEELEPPFSGVQFLGRYAEWQHDRRIDHIVETARAGL